MNWTPALRVLLLLLLALSGRAAAFTPTQYQIYCGFPFYDATQWQLTPNWAARWNALGARTGIPDLGTQLSSGLQQAGTIRQVVSNTVASTLIGNEATQQYYDAWYSAPVLRQLTALGITDPDFGLSTAAGIAQQSVQNDCLSAERRRTLEGFAAQAMAGYQKLGFTSPGGKNLGPVVQAGSQRAVRLYVVPGALYDSVADTSGRCKAGGRIDRNNLSFVKINADQLRGASDAKAFYIIAHELFHVVQNAQGLETKPGLDRCDLLHHWTGEGTADALSLHLTRERFPDYRPSLSDDIGLNFYGLRSMSLSLPQPQTPTASDLRNYRASSFWRHLADRYHGGNYAFYARYLDLPETNAGRDDWLNHADILVSRDASVTIAPEQQQAGRNGLYLTLPDFYTEYATWGTEKFPWIGEAAWMKEAFAPCQTVTLDARTNRSQTLTFPDMPPFSARCVRVKVTGVQVGQRFSVVPMTGPLGNGLADELHLGRARSSGLKAFNCYRDFSVRQLGQTLHPGCLFKPFTGTDGGVRVWQAEADEPAPGRPPEYLWVLSWVPADASDRQLTRRASPTLVLGLDVTTLNSTLPPSPPAPSTTGAPVRKRTVGTVNFEPPDGAQELLPLKGAEQTGLTGDLNLSKLAFGVQDLGVSALNRTMQDATDGDLYSLAVSLADVSFGPVSFGGLTAVQENFESDGDFLGINPERAIKFGQTGTFRARVLGGNNQRSESPMTRLYITPPGADGLPGPGLTLNVTQFDRAALVVEFSGAVCSVPWPPPPTRPLAEHLAAACARTYPVSGTIVKPHAFVYSRAQALTVGDTPGTRLYRQDLQAFLGRAMPGLNTLPGMTGQPIPGGGNSGAAGGGTGGGAGSGVAGSTGACPISDQQLLDFLAYSDDPGDGPPPFDLSVISALSSPACVKRLMELQPQEP